MLLSFLVYTLTALLLALLGWHCSAREQRLMAATGKQLPFLCWEIVAVIVAFATVAGLRYKTGYDHLFYLYQYIHVRDHGGFSRCDYELGFQWISQLFAFFKAHACIYFAFWGALQIGLFYFAFRKKKSILVWIPLVIMLGGFFVNFMNTIRQVVVECAFVAMVPLCTTRKRTAMCGIVALCFTLIHFTAIFVPFFYLAMWLMRGVKLSRRTLYVAYVACVVLGLYPFWLTAFTGVASLLAGTSYERYIPLINDMVANGYRFVPWGPNHLLVVVSQLIMLWFYTQVKEHFSDFAPMRDFFSLAFLGMCLSNLLINTSHFMLRPFEYLSLCLIVPIAFTLKYLYDTRRYVWLAALALCTLTITYIAVIKAVLIPTAVNLPFLYNCYFWR